MTLGKHAHRRAGFTLVELLTVVGIIALLIGILIPSLSKARAQARKVKVSAQLSATEKGLEMFRNDFNDYPDSSSGTSSDPRNDPITDYPGGGSGYRLSGAHWLARALAGHDLQGVDAKGYTLMDRDSVKWQNNRIETGASGGFTIDNLRQLNIDRKGVYIEGNAIWLRDNDQKLFQGGDPPNTGRPVMVDAYNFPVLYYKANTRAGKAFSQTANDPKGIGGARGIGVYNLEDNAALTGSEPSGAAGWQFVAGTPEHKLGKWCASQDYSASGSDPHEPDGNFVGYLHNEAVHELSQSSFPQIKPLNPDSFVLISAGNDGIYGTDDDVNNLKSK